MAITKPSLNLVARGYEHAPQGKPSIMTFTRASSGSRVNAAGIIELKGNNSLRHDYDPTTLEYKGWLIEEARTNLLIQSQTFGTSWTVQNATAPNEDAAVAPDGTTTADELLDSSANAQHNYYQVQAVTSGSAYTISLWAKSSVLSRMRIEMSAGFTATTGDFNLGTGTVIALGAGADSSTITAYPNGWYKLTLTSTATSTTTAFCVLAPINDAGSTSYIGTVQGVYIWGAQLELGAFATSYIPTTTAEVTRAADVATVAVADFDFNNTDSAHTIMVEADTFGNNSESHIVKFETDDNNMFRIGFLSGSAIRGQVGTAASYGNGDFTGLTIDVMYKAILSLSDADYGISVNGGTVATFATPSTIPPITDVSLGHDDASATQFLNGHLRHFAYWPVQITDAEEVEITQ